MSVIGASDVGALNAKMSDCFNILIATDIHLGFKEKDSIRCNDSLITFEEILQIATENEVDFMVLGGDLFHDNKPSRKIMYQTMNLLREYCTGEKKHNFEFHSDPNDVFYHSKFPELNYQNPYQNIRLPIFSIHGNHDDPVGVTGLCSLDILSTCGFVNYFGKFNQIEKLEINPLLFHKNGTKLALYGFGSIRDERLHHIFKEGRITMMQPEENPDEWFNLMVIHQNRYKRGLPTSYIPDSFLDNFIDLLIWGHEHECLIEPQYAKNNSFYVSQPGSSIATSLEKGEVAKKKIALLQIKGKSFKLIPIPLQTVRPFVYDELALANTKLDPSREDLIIEFLTSKLLHMVDQAKEQKSGNPNQPKLPLIRLKVDYTGGFPILKNSNFYMNIAKHVANPDSVILFRKKNQFINENNYEDKLASINNQIINPNYGIDFVKMEDLIEEHLQNNDNKEMQLGVLSSKLLINALNEFISKDEKDSIATMVSGYIRELHSKIVTNLDMENLDKEILLVRSQIESKYEKSNPFLTSCVVPPPVHLNQVGTTMNKDDTVARSSCWKNDDAVKEEPLKHNKRATNSQNSGYPRKKNRTMATNNKSSPQKMSADIRSLLENPTSHDTTSDVLDVTSLPFLEDYSKDSKWSTKGF